MKLKRLLLVTSVLAGGLAFTGTAMANYLISGYNVGIWNADTTNNTTLCGTTGNCSSTSSSQQALPSNPIDTNSYYMGSTTYTGGNLDFFLGSKGTNTIGAFLGSGSGTVGVINPASPYTVLGVEGTELSAKPYAWITLFDFQFTLSQAVSATITHDDGFSIWNSSGVVQNYSSPTFAQTNTFTLAAGTYNLWYAAANGLPEQLNFTMVPEPGSLGILGLGLSAIGALGWIRRRHRKTEVR